MLRTQKLGEADRIITVLARRTGRVRAVGKGVRRTKSRFGARLEPFTHVDLQLYAGRSLDVITQAETLRPYGEPLTGDYPRYTSGVAMLETAERFTPEEKQPALRQFLLLVGGLRTLGEGEHEPAPGARRLPAALARGRRVRARAGGVRGVRLTGGAAVQGDSEGGAAGWGAARVRRRRGRPDLPVLPAGRCGDPGRPDGRPDGRAAAGRLGARGRDQRRHQVECSGLVAAYLQWHLEHSIRSLRHVEHV